MPSPTQFLGNTVGEAAAFAAGLAIAPVLHPIVKTLENEAWRLDPTSPLNPDAVAALVAQGAVVLDTGASEANLTGTSAARFGHLVTLAFRAPTYGEAQDLRRRNKITDDQLRHSFAKAQIETQYWDALADLVDERLSAQAVALGIIRSMIADPGFFPVQLDTAGGKVPAYPVSNIDAITEAAASGFDQERLRVMVGSIGRPPGPVEGAHALFRGLIEQPDFNRLILESDTRPEWAEVFRDVAREILTASQYAELELRGFLTTAQRRTQTQKHGMSDADSDLLYNVLGRSIPEHQIVTGEARGGVFEGPIDTIPKAFLQSLQRGNLRPEYYNLAYANRYSYPSAFVLRSLATSGEITEAEAETLLLQIGWPPELAKTVSASWAPTGAAAKVNPWVKAQQTRLVTAMHKAFVKTGVSRAQLEPFLDSIVTSAADKDEIFRLWGNERAVDALVAP